MKYTQTHNTDQQHFSNNTSCSSLHPCSLAFHGKIMHDPCSYCEQVKSRLWFCGAPPFIDFFPPGLGTSSQADMQMQFSSTNAVTTFRGHACNIRGH